MATTLEVSLDQTTWLAVAAAGNVTITAQGLCRYAIGAAAPAWGSQKAGHVAEVNSDRSMLLSGTEKLWLRGTGAVYVTAEAPL